MQIQSRRDFLASVSTAGAVVALGTRPALGDEPPPETTTIRFEKQANTCFAPQYVAGDLLRAEGFTDVRYVDSGSATAAQSMAQGNLDFTLGSMISSIRLIDAGAPITLLAGVHSGCYELFAYEPVNTITELKGRRVVVRHLRDSPHLFISLMAAYVGLDPASDINWIVPPAGSAMDLFAEGNADAFLGFPPEPQELRDRRVGRVILATATDEPWSQYLCCMLIGNRDYVREHPVATKRVLRAILKAADMCAAEPTWAARRMVNLGFAARYDYALATLGDVSYGRWREYDPADTIRFYALRMRELDFIRSSPNALLAEGTDWRFLNEIKRELKG